LRTDLGQAAGWLIILGAIEYNTIPEFELEKSTPYISKTYGDVNSVKWPEADGSNWKVGAIEPTTSLHGDIEYLYVIDLTNKTLKCYEDWDTETGEERPESEIDISEYTKNIV
jgi:hypothetical protein